ncbi:MAG: hypothetical protein OEZ01_10365 [Candidatus Heimdallarchaeota archaeon]|nr:hypothetical protein [Candidatus Heimdallarchaeota archaeon]MDH5646403.1 hypothetical protein [Candidatus Heimdallarchaeota archaeon]
MKTDNIDVKLLKLRKMLIQVALMDGNISKDEQNIINNVDMHIPDLKKIIKKAYGDGVVTEEEKVKIHNYLKQIMNNAVSVAKTDKRLENEEQILLQQIKNILILIQQEVSIA